MLTQDDYDSIFRELKKVARCAGFQPGHAPVNIIEKQLNSDLRLQKDFVKCVFNHFYPSEKIEKTDPEKLVYKSDNIPGIIACYLMNRPGSLPEIWDTIMQ